jgi:hypothetical protein
MQLQRFVSRELLCEFGDKGRVVLGPQSVDAHRAPAKHDQLQPQQTRIRRSACDRHDDSNAAADQRDEDEQCEAGTTDSWGASNLRRAKICG